MPPFARAERSRGPLWVQASGGGAASPGLALRAGGLGVARGPGFGEALRVVFRAVGALGFAGALRVVFRAVRRVGFAGFSRVVLGAAFRRGLRVDTGGLGAFREEGRLASGVGTTPER